MGRMVLMERESLWSPVGLECVRRLLKLSPFQAVCLLDAKKGVLR
jgi:hypothetical protein